MGDDVGAGFLAAHARLLERIARGASVPDTLDAIVRLIEDQAQGMLCSILRFDPSDRTLHTGAAPHLPSEYLRAIDGVTIGPDVGSCGTAAFLRERVVVRDLANDPRWARYHQLALPHGLRACWSSPIMAPGGELLGTFAMYYREVRDPSPQELAWVDAATHVAAIVIVRDQVEQALRRSEHRAQELARLHAVSSRVHEAIVRERDPQALYDVACRCAVELGLAQLAWVGLLDGDDARIAPVARFGNHEGYVDAIALRLDDERVNRGPAAQAIRTNAAAIANDLAHDEAFYWRDEALHRGLYACAVFPLRHGPRVSGVLAIYGDRAGYFRDEEIQVLGRMADDLSLAVEAGAHERERARLYAALGERTVQLERTQRLYSALSQVNHAIVRDSGRAQLLGDVSRALVLAGGFSLAWIGWLDPATGAVVPVTYAGDHDEYLRAIRVFDGFDADLADLGPTAASIRDAQPDVRNHLPAAPTGAAPAWRASAAFPIRRAGAFCGALAVYARDAGYFGPHEQALLAEVAHDVSFALDNLDREAHRQEMEAAVRVNAARLRLLHELGEATREVSDPDRILPVVLRLLGQHLRVSRCHWAEVAADADHLIVPHEYVDGVASMVGQYRLWDFGARLSGELRRGDGPVVLNDVDADLGASDAAPLRAFGIKALVCCALIRDGRLRALMAVHQAVPRAWTADEVALVQEVAARSWATIEQRGAEAQLLQRDALLRIAGRAARLGGWSIELPAMRVTWSEEVCAIHDVAAGTVPTVEELLAFYAPADGAELQRQLEACARDGSPFDREMALVTARGRRTWVRAIGQAERNADGSIARVAGALQDVSERHALEEQLRQAQKMEAVGRLAGGIAHDFNNVLTVILSYADMMVGGLAPGDPMAEDAAEIQRAGQRAADLTRQLLMFSRQQVLAPKLLDLNELLASMDRMLRRLVGEDVELVLVNGADLGAVRGDPSSVEQVIMNLVVNARDAMPGGGCLTIETANAVLHTGEAREPIGVGDGAYVVLAVSDTGMGMDEATQARIFEPFFTTKDTGKGTGLGLSTVYGIVAQSGGHIRIESAPGAGATFRIYWPRVDGVVDATVEAPRAHTLRGAETVLVVEDDDAVRAVVRSVLRRGGYHVLEAQNAGEALLTCEQHDGQVHLLLTDLVMPRMSGRQLAERLQPIQAGMRVLFMSGYTEDAIVQQGVRDAGVAFLPKPFTPEALLRKVREVLETA